MERFIYVEWRRMDDGRIYGRRHTLTTNIKERDRVFVVDETEQCVCVEWWRILVGKVEREQGTTTMHMQGESVRGRR